MSVPTPHISAKLGDFAEGILLPGDPLRAKYIAEKFLDDPVLVTDVRGILGYTGYWKGHRVSAMGTGMGIPSISIYVNELIREYGVKNLIRVGTAGGLSPELKAKDLLLGMGCCTDNGFLRETFNGDYCPIADFEMLNTAYDKIVARGQQPHVGLLKSTDLFYGENEFNPFPDAGKLWRKYGVIGGEMEGAALYTLAARYGCRALCICSVSDGPFIKVQLTSEEREKSLDNMLEVALDTIIEF